VKHLTTLAATALALVAAVLSPAGTASLADAEPAPEGIAPPLTLTTAAELDDAIDMTTRPGTDDLYVAERGGVVHRLIVDGSDITVSPTPVIDISALTNPDGERGLLGLTFSPTGNRLFLHHTNNAGNTRLVEYRMNVGGHGQRAMVSTRRVVLSIRQPFPNHNGGTITYGPDRFLYMALGDGGDGGDPMNNGQDLRVLLGKILRISPNQAPRANFTVPGSNPFAGQPPRQKAIWLYGVRNPFRISFDRETGDLYVADVGQGEIEEIDVLPADDGGRNAGRGANLGWRRMEGTQPFNGGTEPANHTPPVFEFDHDDGSCAVIGGYVYRGTALPFYDGTYFYGDFCTGTIGTLTVVDGTLVESDPDVDIPVTPFTLQAFGQGTDGEVYVLTNDGTVARIEAEVP
jgi:glucose/arabinose dehydrogenase